MLFRSLKRNYYYAGREWPYKDVPRKIICEEYMVDESENELKDYKVWCFNGEPKYIQIISGRDSGNTYEAFYNFNWTKHEFYLHNKPLKEICVKPSNLDLIIENAKILSEGKAFSRCDFYIIGDGSIRFGEITFYPMCGFESFTPEEWDYKLGSYINLPKKQNI